MLKFSQLQQYKGVSEHFERRVLDLQGDLRTKEDEITKITEKYESSKKDMERLRNQLASRPSPGNFLLSYPLTLGPKSPQVAITTISLIADNRNYDFCLILSYLISHTGIIKTHQNS